MLILNTLTPVFLLIAIGAVLQRTGFVSPGFLKEANRVTYWLGLPALLFTELTRSFHHAVVAERMLLGMAIATGLVIVLAYVFAWMLRVPGAAQGTFVQGAFRGNLAFVGLPLVYALPDTILAGGVSARAAAIVVVGPMMVAYNLVAVVVLLLSQHRLGWNMLRPFLRQLFTTPPLLATLAGIAFAVAGWSLPGAVDRTFFALGEMALPLGLLGVGGSLVTASRASIGKSAVGAALTKTVASPLLGWATGRALGLHGLELQILVLFMAVPTAVISYVMAVELKGDEAIASGTIVLSVLTSFVALAVILALPFWS